VSQRYFPEWMFDAGYTDLISVVPPDAQLTPTSKIQGQMLGKVPGRRLPNGLWAGYDWRKAIHTLNDVKQWALHGANVGLRADHFPGVDIDVKDEHLAAEIADFALRTLGPAPLRIGRYPKRLLVYRTEEPFSRMRLWIKAGEVHHLVEVLGQGQQFLVHGIHPNTGKPFEWRGDVPHAAGLTTLTREQADAFLTSLAEYVEMMGLGTVEREGDGRPQTRTAASNQTDLLAPSLDALRTAVGVIPNDNATFPDRTSYLKMGYAIRAAAGVDGEPEGQAIFADWASRWEGNDRAPNGNDPDTVLADWRRMRGPYAIGWSWVAEMASGHGYNAAQHDFEAVPDEPTAPNEAPRKVGPSRAPFLSDQWLAAEVIANRGAEIRYVAQWDQFLVWRRQRWQPDAVRLAEDIVKDELKKVANFVVGMGATDSEQKMWGQKAERIASAGTATAVRTLLQSDPAIALAPDALDHNPWLLNTPNGGIDLRSGKLLAADPDALHTKATLVPADFHAEAPEWHRFLNEATNNDAELKSYLQRLAGYCLTGDTSEQHLTFIHGPPGTGKSQFLRALFNVLGDYAKKAPMAAFTESKFERHETEVAMLHRARLVTASETKQSGRWDEARITELTGGEAVSARFMRENHFTFVPQFKLLFAGNHRPSLAGIQGGIRRRLHLVPFVTYPKIVDKDMPNKLEKEYPAILAWMIEGCLLWQKYGLQPPQIVLDTTQDYLHDEDAVGRWMEQRTELDFESAVLSNTLYADWREWCGENGEHAGSLRRFVAALQSNKIEKWQDGKTRRNGFKGLKLKPRELDSLFT